jgi:hypothetical protein
MSYPLPRIWQGHDSCKAILLQKIVTSIFFCVEMNILSSNQFNPLGAGVYVTRVPFF